MAKAGVGFRVFIDESGDEGFKFEPGGGHGWSSLWFVISAVIVRTENEMEQVSVIDEIRKRLGKDRSFSVHCREMKHEQKSLCAELVGQRRFRTVSVAIYKPAIAAPETFNERYRLYFYATRYLLERVSWLCRDTRRDPADKAEIIFSNRAGMSYDELRAYLGTLLKASTTGTMDVRIDWSVVDCALIKAEQHKKLMGLQVADIVASSTFSALHHNRHNLTETGYLRRLRGIAYKHRGMVTGHGLKVWPNDAVKDPDAVEAIRILSSSSP